MYGFICAEDRANGKKAIVNYRGIIAEQSEMHPIRKCECYHAALHQ
jgi:hypothetical protein